MSRGFSCDYFLRTAFSEALYPLAWMIYLLKGLTLWFHNQSPLLSTYDCLQPGVWILPGFRYLGGFTKGLIILFLNYQSTLLSTNDCRHPRVWSVPHWTQLLPAMIYDYIRVIATDRAQKWFECLWYWLIWSISKFNNQTKTCSTGFQT